MSHSTVGIALFGPNISDNVTVELPNRETVDWYDNFTRAFVLILVHRNDGPVARANICILHVLGMRF